MPTTPTYGFRYPAITDPPNGSTLALNLATDVEAKFVASDAVTALKLPIASIAALSVSITPVANTPTSAVVSWGKTLPGTVYAVATPVTTVPGTVVLGVGVSSVTSTGCTVWITRTSTTPTSIHVIAIGF